MIRITASHGRKVPGRQEYSTLSYHCSIEVELCDAVPEEVLKRVHAMWSDLERAVDQRVEAQQPETGRANGNGHGPSNGHHADGMGQRYGSTGNGHHGEDSRSANGNGRSADRPENSSNGGLSAKQKSFLIGLGSKRAWRVPRLNEELRSITGRDDATLHSLSKFEASACIEVMKGEQ